MTTINIFTLTVRGSTLDVRICRRQILRCEVDPRAVRVDPFSEWNDSRRNNLTSVVVRFRRLKTVPTLNELKIYNGSRLINISILIKWCDNFKLTLSSLTLHRHLRPLQAANCCRNSRLVVDEDDLMRVKK